MRVADVNNKGLAFKRLEPREMVRVALIKGLKEKPQEYNPLVKEYVWSSLEKYIDELSTSLSKNEINSRLERLLLNFRYNSPVWEQLNYGDLESESIIKKSEGNISQIVDDIMGLQDYNVLSIESNITDGNTDYLKHVKPKNKLMLDGKKTIRKFAELKNISLPGKYIETSSKDNALYEFLDEEGFNFQNALASALMARNGKTSLITFRRPGTGEEVRTRLIDIIEANEFYEYIKKYSKEDIFFPNGSPKEVGQLRYEGEVITHVPKRTPGENRRSFNKTEFHYIPRFNGDKAISWMYIDPSCDCVYAENLRNFHHKGKDSLRKRTIKFLDIHANVALLEMVNDLDLNPATSPNNLVPVLSPIVTGFVDKLRYNVYRDKKKLTKIEMEILLHEFASKIGYKNMFITDERKISPFITRMY